ncbi:gephyrin-like molybdotransferase receptor GlpR [Kitasatospora sp. NPDC096147]|uniref:divisome protein SepX/GlpR n=1 Tax=Kitasatospora sp. NPDC096147 TaxID=3364093 RepID=UPI00381E6286
MSSSGLIYAVIVGAWAAYLVPMWLRRQDELNEARPTERFSTAIRLLAGRSAMERRASKALGEETSGSDDGEEPVAGDTGRSGDPAEPRAAADPAGAAPTPPSPAVPSAVPSAPSREAARGSVERRARLLARRRRMVTTLFLAFAAGAVAAAVLGVAFLWIPAVPALLLTGYIGHLRRLERQRYEVKLDRARAANAAERLHEREHTRAASRMPAPAPEPAPAEPAAPTDRQAARPVREDGRPHLRLATTDSALVEATDHEEWVDGMRDRAPAGPDSWEPVPVPLPTYVTAPVAPRTTPGLDPRATAWDSGRANTPLFDQYAEPRPEPAAHPDRAARPRAANE